LLDGGIPDVPPHWELVFQIPKEMFGIDAEVVANGQYDSEAARLEAMAQCHMEIYWRLIEECNWAAVPPPNPYNAKSVAQMKKALGEHALIPGYDGYGVFWMPTGSDIMDFVVKIFERPDELQQEARQKCDNCKELLQQMADAGADFFILTYDFGFNDAPFISPKHFREFVTPYLTEIVQKVHDLGKLAILHSDGCLTEILDQIYSTGVDGYQSVDPQGGMDIKAVREAYPEWLLMGNVSCSLLQETNDLEIRKAVNYCMTHGGMGKRYIFSTSNCIYAGMPAESYKIMLDEYRNMVNQQLSTLSGAKKLGSLDVSHLES